MAPTMLEQLDSAGVSVSAAVYEVLTRKTKNNQGKSSLSMERASIFEAFWVLRVAETREMTFVQHGGVVSDHYNISKKNIFFVSTFFHKC